MIQTRCDRCGLHTRHATRTKAHLSAQAHVAEGHEEVFISEPGNGAWVRYPYWKGAE